MAKNEINDLARKVVYSHLATEIELMDIVEILEDEGVYDFDDHSDDENDKILEDIQAEVSKQLSVLVKKVQ